MASNDEKNLIPFKRALTKNTPSSPSSLSIEWNTILKTYTYKKENLEKFKAKVKAEDIDFVLDSLKTCKYYEPKKPNHSSLMKILYCVLGFVLGTYLMFIFATLTDADCNYKHAKIITATVFIILLILLGWICYSYKNWKENFEILLRRKKELQAKLDEHNKIGIWYYRNLSWRCGNQGAYLFLKSKDYEEKKTKKRKKEKDDKNKKGCSGFNIPEIQFKPSINISSVDYKGGRKGKKGNEFRLEEQMVEIKSKKKKKLTSVPNSVMLEKGRDEQESMFALHNPSLNISIEHINSEEYYYDYDI